jgi:cell wall-associated NlpC family hydrolase
MITPFDVVAQARKYLGVRWQHQGRNRHALDCAGLIVRVAHDLRLSDFDFIDYDRRPFADTMRTVMSANCISLEGHAPAPGMVALMRFEREPQHLGFVTDYPFGGLALIHAYAISRKVVEHRLDPKWQRRIVALFELPGVIRYGA